MFGWEQSVGTKNRSRGQLGGFCIQARGDEGSHQGAGHVGGEKQSESGIYSGGRTNMITKTLDVGYKKKGESQYDIKVLGLNNCKDGTAI